jgi:protein required for attachment to host cells
LIDVYQGCRRTFLYRCEQDFLGDALVPHRIHPLTWILTADGHHARVWEWKSREQPLTLVPDFVRRVENVSKFSRGMKSDRPGRSHASTGMGRSSIEPKSDPHTHEKDEFARELASDLDKALKEHRFRKLIVIASPHMLGSLRQNFSPQLEQVIAGQSDKDYMNADVEALYYHAAQISVG